MIRTVHLATPRAKKTDAWKRAQKAWYLRHIERERAKARERYWNAKSA